MTHVGARAPSGDEVGPEADRMDLAKIPLGSRSALELLASVADAFFTLDSEWRFSFVNAAAEDLLATTAEQLVGEVIWMRFPEAVGSQFEDAYRTAVADQKRVAFTAFFPPLDRWFAVQAVPHKTGLSVLFHDVSELKRAERKSARLAETHELLRQVATAVAAGEPAPAVFDLLCQRTVELFDAHSCWALRFTDVGAAVVGRAAPDDDGGLLGIGDEFRITPAGQLATVRTTGEPESGRSQGRLGEWGLTSSAVVPVRLLGGLWGALSIGWTDAGVDASESLSLLGDLAELVGMALGNIEARAMIERLAATDALTGLANLRTCQQRLDDSVSRARRHGHALTLALVDIDHFKDVNDGFGHAVGDHVLNAVAGALTSVSREEDLAARIGGDEFALVLDDTDAKTALTVAERLRQRISSLAEPGIPPVTVSIGLSDWLPGQTREDMQRHADDALYWAKLHGRNAAWIYDDDMMQQPRADTRAAELRRADAIVDSVDLQQRVQQTKAFWRSTLDAMSQQIAVLNETGEIIATNAAWRRFASENGGPPGVTGVGTNYLAVCDSCGDATAAQAAQGIRDLLADKTDTFELDYPCDLPGAKLWFTLRASRFLGDHPRRIVVHHEDITMRRHARDQIAHQAQLLDRIPGAVVATDSDDRITQWSAGAERLYGYSREEAIGAPVEELLSVEDESNRRRLKHAAGTGDGWEGELRIRDKSGSLRPVFIRSVRLADAEGRAVGSVAVSVDISERIAHQLEIQAAHDYLVAVTSSIESGLLTCDRDGIVSYANDAAAELLRRPLDDLIGLPLRSAIYGGTESDDGASPLADGEATARCDDDLFVREDGTSLEVSWTSTQLTRGGDADGRVVVFVDNSVRKAQEARLRRESDGLKWAARIRTALEENRFALFAQPIVAASDRTITSHELLIRLADGQGGYVSPVEFLPAAEEHGLMGDIDLWVIDQGLELACQQVHVHLNLSAQSIEDPAILDRLWATLEGKRGVAERVTIELTETALVSNLQTGRQFAMAVRALGCRLALDDFGTGYNSFARVKDFPVDELKIDMQFVRDVLTDSASASVVTAIVSLARVLGIVTVAEGVEEQATADHLRDLGVTYLQGYEFGRPRSMKQTFRT